LSESAFDGPLLDSLHQAPAYAMVALVRSHNQAQDFAGATGFQDVLFRRMDPACHPAAFRQVSDKREILRPGQEPFNSPPHDLRLNRVA